jgi:hypothetical protein
LQKVSIVRSLLSLLRDGGLILFARHGEATVGIDQANLNFQDCSTQRNLSYYGRRQALLYGETLRNLDIPVMYPVQASPFCRTRETAKLAFWEENIQVDPFWLEIYRLSGNLNEQEKERILSSLRSVLEIKPTMGSNKVIIAHSFPEGVGLGEIPNMGTVIVKPRGEGNGYEIVTKLTLEEFLTL